MRTISLGLALIALTTLMIELALIRVFDVILFPNMAYMVVTSALLVWAWLGYLLPSGRDLRSDM